MTRTLPFTPKTKMADVIHINYHLIPIISRFGIKYGFGNQTVSEVCDKNNINIWFFLEILNSYHNPAHFPKNHLQNFSINLIIEYLSNTHSYYLDIKIPDIQRYIDEMERTVSEENLKNIKLLNDFFKEYKKELNTHLDYEESKVFPYILDLEQAVAKLKYSEKIIKKIKEDSIEKYERNHDNLEIKLYDLKNLIIKFLPPVLCMSTCQNLLTELFRLEKDIENHTRIEEKVLIPKVKLLENKVLENCGTN